MDRRTYLRRVGTVSVPLVAGCAGDGGTDETTQTTTRDPTPTAATTAEPTTAGTTPTSASTTTPGTADATTTETVEPATTTGTTDATATETADATTTATATPATTSTTPQTTVAADVAIDVAGLAYDPVRASADVGDTVAWTNQDGAGHNVVSAQFTDAATEWSYSSPILGTDERATYTFESAGAYEYYCSIHGRNTMCGVVVVGDATHEASLPCEG